jgi:hypothetical protein
MFNVRGLSKSKAIEGLGVALLMAALAVLPACSVNVNKDAEKEGGKNVDIKSPIGDLHVSEQVDIRDSGLTVYPGATPAPKENNDEKSANVNLSLPGFSMKVIAAEFLSDDPPAKITAYYDKELQKFGKPIQCQGAYSKSTSMDVHDDKDELSKAVSCDKSDGGGDSLELKVGTEGNQHMVSVKPNNKGTRFALVFVRLHTGKDTTI